MVPALAANRAGWMGEHGVIEQIERLETKLGIDAAYARELRDSRVDRELPGAVQNVPMMVPLTF